MQNKLTIETFYTFLKDNNAYEAYFDVIKNKKKRYENGFNFEYYSKHKPLFPRLIFDAACYFTNEEYSTCWHELHKKWYNYLKEIGYIKKEYCNYYCVAKSKTKGGDYIWWKIVKYLLGCNNYTSTKKDIVKNTNLKSHTMLSAMKYLGIVRYNIKNKTWQLQSDYVKKVLKT